MDPTAGGGATPPGGRSASGADEEPAAAATTLGALRAAPARALGQRVRFVLQRGEEQAAWNPYHSRFGPASWSAFTAWPDEVLPWRREARADPARRLFARRGGAVQAQLSHARPYDRFEVVAVVREVFLNEPWIELVEARRLDTAIGEGTVLHATRAIELLESESWQRAVEELDRALAAELPAHAEAELRRLRALAEERLAEAEAGR